MLCPAGATRITPGQSRKRHSIRLRGARANQFYLKHFTCSVQLLGVLLNRDAVLVTFDLTDEKEAVLRLLQRYSNILMSLADASLVRMTETLSNPLLLTTDSDFRFSVVQWFGSEKQQANATPTATYAKNLAAQASVRRDSCARAPEDVTGLDHNRFAGSHFRDIETNSLPRSAHQRSVPRSGREPTRHARSGAGGDVFLVNEDLSLPVALVGRGTERIKVVVTRFNADGQNYSLTRDSLAASLCTASRSRIC